MTYKNLFPSLMSILIGCSLSARGEVNDTTNDNTELSTEGERKFVDVAKKLNLKPLKPGKWVVEGAFHQISETKGTKSIEIPVPIEVIDDPLIVERVKGGLRPDGEAMYHYPEVLPDGYPPEWLDFSIDIFPKKVSPDKGVTNGSLILHGHFIKPPYKFQIVVINNRDVRLLINGIDVSLSFRPTEEELRREKYRNKMNEYKEQRRKMISTLPRNHNLRKANATRFSMQIISDVYSPLLGKKTIGMMLLKAIKEEPNFIKAELKNNYLTYYISNPPSRAPLRIDIILARRKKFSLSKRLDRTISEAGAFSSDLSKGRTLILFRNIGQSTWDRKKLMILKNVCNHPAPYSNNEISRLKEVLRRSKRVIYLLANCAR